MRKLLIFLCLFFFLQDLPAQKCQDPAVRLKRLRAVNVTRDTLEKWAASDQAFLQLRPGEIVADIGTYDGYYPVLYSVLADSVTFYLNDIDTDGFVFLDSIREVCTKIAGGETACRFIITLGDSVSSGLPAKTFDKVLVRDALHHFKHREEMLNNLRSLLKPGGKLLVFEPLRIPGAVNQNLCPGAMTRDELLQLMSRNGFSVKREEEPGKGGAWFELGVER
jgi:SAM-dependent methyltransferase